MKIVLPLILLLLSSVLLKAQQAVLFKIKVLPNHTYTSNIKMNMDMIMTTPTTAKSATKPKSATTMKVTTTSVNTDKTGIADNNGKFPFTMTMKKLATKMIMNGKETNMPTGIGEQKIYGTCTEEGKMNIDSIPGGKLTDTMKRAMLKTIKKTMSSIDFPERSLKVGDIFTQKTPIDIPVMGASATMLSVRNYKLTAIQNDKAYFDVNYTIDMDMNMKKANMEMKGGGTEKLIYDINQNYAASQQENMKLVYYVTVPQLKGKMKGTMNMVMTQITTIK